MKQSSLLVVGDADALVALLFTKDAMHQRARAVTENLDQAKATVIFPATAFVEAVTTLQRKLNSKKAAGQAIEQLRSGQMLIEPVDHSLLVKAAAYFQPKRSKQHTLFDAIVLALARETNAAAIFSFDRWYAKQGFRLAEELA